jgi:hypothetical protein
MKRRRIFILAFAFIVVCGWSGLNVYFGGTSGVTLRSRNVEALAGSGDFVANNTGPGKSISCKEDSSGYSAVAKHCMSENEYPCTQILCKD